MQLSCDQSISSFDGIHRPTLLIQQNTKSIDCIVNTVNSIYFAHKETLTRKFMVDNENRATISVNFLRQITPC